MSHTRAPADVSHYYQRLAELSTLPFWQREEFTEPAGPERGHVWHWQDVYPELARSRQFAADAAGLQRRALILRNPGLTAPAVGATPTIAAAWHRPPHPRRFRPVPGRGRGVTAMLNRISVNGTELEYELRGTGAGEPVVLIHWGVAAATWAEPLLDQPALASRYQLLSYHRAGFAGSGPLQGPPTMAAHAAHCHQLMHELGITRAHIVGHSSSVPVALQLALDAPDAVHTLTLMEAARPAAPTDAERQFGTDVVLAALQRYRAGDKAAAVDIFFSGVFGPGYRAALDHGLPGAFEQAVADADAFFTQEIPAIQQWPFTEDDAHRVQQPVLAVLGTASTAMFAERRKLLLHWLPNAEPLDLPGLTHLLHAQDPAAVAEGLTGFFARHPIPEPL